MIELLTWTEASHRMLVRLVERGGVANAAELMHAVMPPYTDRTTPGLYVHRLVNLGWATLRPKLRQRVLTVTQKGLEVYRQLIASKAQVLITKKETSDVPMA